VGKLNKNMKINKMKNNQGQIAIIVLLTSAIILSLGLSASKKAVIDTKVETDEELLKEAFNTAESGINTYLNTDGASSTYLTESGSSAVVTKENIGGDSSSSLSSEGEVLKNTPQLFWLVNHNSDGSIGNTFYASDFKIEADDFSGALKVDYFYIDAVGVYRVSRFGCYSGADATFVGFDGDCSNISVTGKDSLLVAVTPLGGSARITVSGSSDFPLQGEQLTSVGTVDSGIKTQVKTRHVYQIPSFMLESITAGSIIR